MPPPLLLLLLLQLLLSVEKCAHRQRCADAVLASEQLLQLLQRGGVAGGRAAGQQVKGALGGGSHLAHRPTANAVAVAMPPEAQDGSAHAAQHAAVGVVLQRGCGYRAVCLHREHHISVLLAINLQVTGAGDGAQVAAGAR